MDLAIHSDCHLPSYSLGFLDRVVDVTDLVMMSKQTQSEFFPQYGHMYSAIQFQGQNFRDKKDTFRELGILIQFQGQLACMIQPSCNTMKAL